MLLVAALVMALIVRPPPPPSIAELGPSPQEQIEEARENQAAGSGSGDIAAAAEDEQSRTAKQQKGSTTTTADPSSTTTSAKKVPSTRRCFGDPPRQTEDPHSPPCVFEIFEGDNGGKTAPGVTATEVQIVVSSGVHDDYVEEYVEALLSHFNDRYEFYGRRIDVVAYHPRGVDNPSESSAAADEALSSDPFAAVTRHANYGNITYHARLAEEQVHSIISMPPNFSSSEVDDGLFWSAYPMLDHRGGVAGELICRALIGKVARHAGDNNYKDTHRRFAIVNRRFESDPTWPDIKTLRAKLQECEADFEEFKIVSSQSNYIELIRDLKTGGFTTVSDIAYLSDFENIAEKANGLSYFPEWFGVGLRLEDLEATWSGSRAGTQAGAAFGIAPWTRVRSADETPGCWAFEEGGSRCDSSLSAKASVIEELYVGLLILASGIQMSGPNLTPQSFRQALWGAVWPNPGAGSPPYWQQRVGFGPGDAVFYDDYAIWWWNESAPKKQIDHTNSSGPGSFCYLNRGGRFTPGALPGDADRRLFNEEPCR